MSFPKKLREVREDKGYTQQELADVLHVSCGTISHYENGSREPGVETIIQLAAFLDVSTDYLMDITAINLPLKEIQKQYCKGVGISRLIKRLIRLDPTHRQLLVSILNCIEMEQFVKAQGEK